MKKSVLGLLFLPLLITTTYAQKLGIKAGGNFSSIMGKDGNGDKIKYSFIPGFHAGGFGEFDLGQALSVQLEACYSQKGAKFKTTSSMSVGPIATTVETDMTEKYGYLDVPLIFNIHFGQMGGYVGIGPQLSFLMSYKWDGTVVNTTVNSTTNPPVTTIDEFTDAGSDKTGISKTDFGLTFGMGSKWEGGIEYCLRAGYGLTNIIDQSVSSSNSIIKHLVFSASIGYAFGVGSGGQKDRYGRSYNKKRR